MKKAIILGITLLSVSTLFTACSNSTNSTASKAEHTTVSKNEKVRKALEKEINEKGKIATVKLNKDISDEQSETAKDGSMKPHEEIQVTFTNKTMIDSFKKADDGDMSAQAIVQSYKEMTNKYAKKLNNSHDTVSMGYKIDADNTQAIALSTKEKQIIQ